MEVEIILNFTFTMSNLEKNSKYFLRSTDSEL